MNTNTASPPQKKSVNQEVMQAKERIKQALKQENMSPDTLIQLGNMAEQSIKNQALYPMVLENAAKMKLIDQKNLQKGVDYKLIASLVGAGKLAQMIKQEG
jgi:hypothetical protein